MKADPFAQLKLLDLQELDSTLDQLRHRLATLPEEAQLRELAKERVAVENRLRDAQVRVDDLTRAQKKADADVEQVRARRTRDQERMDKGLVSSPKDLERMQHEMVSLERRISTLEDTELEIMEELEEAQRERDALAARRDELDAQVTDVTKARDEQAAGIQDQLAKVAEDRKVGSTGMPDDLVALYEKLRAQKGGVGAAPLRARRCEGCSLELNAADLGVIAKAPTDEVLRCEECSRILVRTSESGI